MNRRRSLWVVMLFVAAALLAGCHGDPNVRKQKYLESGKRYSAEGKYREAAIQYLNALKVDKNYPDAHYELAQAYEHLGQFRRGVWRTGAHRGLAADELQGADRPWQPLARRRQDRRRASTGQCRDGSTTEQS